MKIRPAIPISIGVLALIVLGALLALRPAPVVVETSTVQIGRLQVVTEDQAETRSHDRYVVAAPVAGRLLRVMLREGDAVRQGDSVATLAPVPLSDREREEVTARVEAGTATERAAAAQLDHAVEDLAQARRESARLEELAARGLASAQQLEQARNTSTTMAMEAAAARDRVRAAEAEVRGARAALAGVQQRPGAPLLIRAPGTGRILRVVEPSERVINAGTPILVIGDLAHLEIMMEMLSSEAVKVAPGMPALLVGWGGAQPLRARVRLVEPYAFTKVSALGVEEKRTNVILDFVDPPGTLGDGYRVWARVVIFDAPQVLKAPVASVYRCGAEWCVFVVEGNRVHVRRIGIAHRNETEVEVVSGLRPGETVVRHPPNELTDGARVRSAPQSVAAAAPAGGGT